MPFMAIIFLFLVACVLHFSVVFFHEKKFNLSCLGVLSAFGFITCYFFLCNNTVHGPSGPEVSQAQIYTSLIIIIIIGLMVQVFDSPHLQVLVGKRVRRRLDVKSIVQLLRSLDAPFGICFVFVFILALRFSSML
jgi:uncharacterized PurR-regulated membrane protein YhhQ (DUF165 family)